MSPISTSSAGTSISCAVADDGRALWLEVHQLADGLGGAAAGERFEVAAEDDEGDQERGRLVEDGLLAAEAGVGEEGIDDGDEVRRADAGGVEEVHVGQAAAEAVPGVHEELASGAEDERRRQREEDDLLAHERRDDALQRLVVAEGADHDDERRAARR